MFRLGLLMHASELVLSGSVGLSQLKLYGEHGWRPELDKCRRLQLSATVHHSLLGHTELWTTGLSRPIHALCWLLRRWLAILDGGRYVI